MTDQPTPRAPEAQARAEAIRILNIWDRESVEPAEDCLDALLAGPLRLAAPEPTAPGEGDAKLAGNSAHDDLRCCRMCGHGFHHDSDCGEVVGYDHLSGDHECGCPGEVTPDDLQERALNALAWLVRLKDGPRDLAYMREKEQAWDEARDVLDVLHKRGLVKP